MKLRFTKMHGLGNDFVVLDGIRQRLALGPEDYRFLADRHFGIGCDQVLLVEAATRPDADFRYRIFNADGGEVQQCGNGARCFVRFVHDQGLTDKREIRVETASGIIVPHLEADGQVTVDMGPPRFEPADIPFQAEARALTYVLDIGQLVEIAALSMGNPHAVLETCNVDTAPVAEWGPLIERHPRFPERVNVGFMQLLHRRAIKLRVFERGSGETLACGTGACAAVVAGISRGLLDSSVEVQTLGGRLSSRSLGRPKNDLAPAGGGSALRAEPGALLTIRWEGEGRSVFMTGPAASVFEGEIDMNSVDMDSAR